MSESIVFEFSAFFELLSFPVGGYSFNCKSNFFEFENFNLAYGKLLQIDGMIARNTRPANDCCSPVFLLTARKASVLYQKHNVVNENEGSWNRVFAPVVHHKIESIELPDFVRVFLHRFVGCCEKSDQQVDQHHICNHHVNAEEEGIHKVTL